jgi:hypothetical protein
VSREAAVDLLSIQGGLDCKVELELKEWSESFALNYCQKFQWYGAPVSLETGPRVTQYLPLVVTTTARVALGFNLAIMEDGVGLGLWNWGFGFWIGDQARCHSCWQG